MDGRECVAQRYVGVRNAGECFAVINRGVYGSRFEKESIFHSLIRGAGYCVHPIGDRALFPEKRYVKRMDQCEHLFEFRVVLCKQEEVERLSQEFNRKAYALNVFPISEGCDNGNFDVEISDSNILLTTLKKGDNGYIFRLFNGSTEEKQCILRVGAQRVHLTFSKYEVKTLKALADSLCEIEMEI
jgi:alpha-mannosidase